MPQNVTELKDVTQEKSQDGYSELMPLILQWWAVPQKKPAQKWQTLMTQWFLLSLKSH